MNWSHFNTLLWLRYRLTANHLRRHGELNFVILAIASALALLGAITGFFLALGIGTLFLQDVSPTMLMYLCDGWLLGFLFFWMTGVLTDLQRGEMLSVDKLLHLPTTLAEVFVFNFLNSLVALSTLTFIPPMLGLCIAVLWTKGPACLVMFPLVATFVFMVAAVTYQFRGWLATLMSNKRRQRTIVVTITFVFMIVMQTPQLIHFAFQRQLQHSHTESRARRDELMAKLRTGEITREEYDRQTQAAGSARDLVQSEQWHGVTEIVNMVLPLGWLAYGTKAAAAGNPWPGLAGSLGMAGITAYCLRRSYRTTLRYFTGEFNKAGPRDVALRSISTTAPAHASKSTSILDGKFPFASEASSAVAGATLISLLRAPEVKMLLLGPLVMVLIFGGMLFSRLGQSTMADGTRSLIPLGVLGLSILGIMQLSINAFGFDRSGFRAYVLSGAPRYQILVGKNLAIAPLLFIPAGLLMAIAQMIAPAPTSAFAAAVIAMPTAYLWLCLLGNYGSILCPIGQAAGSMKPTNMSGIVMLMQFAFLSAATLIIGVAALIPLATEWLLTWWGWSLAMVPIAAIITFVELAVSVWLYWIVVRHQGDLLSSREYRILDAVIAKGE